MTKIKTDDKVVVSNGEKIWKAIKDKQVSMFGLPPQKVSDVCSFINVNPDACFLTYKIPAFLPALETALADKYTVDREDKYIVVKAK